MVVSPLKNAGLWNYQILWHVKLNLSNQDLLARKFTFFLLLEETYVVGSD